MYPDTFMSGIKARRTGVFKQGEKGKREKGEKGKNPGYRVAKS